MLEDRNDLSYDVSLHIANNRRMLRLTGKRHTEILRPLRQK